MSLGCAGYLEEAGGRWVVGRLLHTFIDDADETRVYFLQKSREVRL